MANHCKAYIVRQFQLPVTLVKMMLAPANSALLEIGLNKRIVKEEAATVSWLDEQLQVTNSDYSL